MTRASAAAGLALVAFACSPTPQPLPTPTSPIVVRQSLPNGWLEVTLRQRYARGGPIEFPVVVSVTAGAVRGPLAARVVASGMSGEVTVRTLDVPRDGLDTRAGETRSLAVRWDGTDEAGVVPPADEYVLVVELASETGGAETPATIGVVFALADP